MTPSLSVYFMCTIGKGNIGVALEHEGGLCVLRWKLRINIDKGCEVAVTAKATCCWLIFGNVLTCYLQKVSFKPERDCL